MMKPFKVNPYVIFAHLIMLGFQLFFWNFIIDDAFISFRYAKNLFLDHQLVFNINEPPVEGYSNFLWVIWIYLGFILNFEPILFSKISGIVFSHLSIYVLYRFALLLRKSRKSSAIIALFYACLPNVALWSIGGLETSLFSLLLMIAIYFFISNLIKKKKDIVFLSSLFFTLASLTRPEGIIVFVISILFLIGIQIRDRKIFTLQSFILILLMFSCVGLIYTPYFIWRMIYYNSILPHTFLAKTETVTLLFLLGQIAFYLPLILVLIPIIILILLKAKNFKRLSNLAYNHIYLGLVILVLSLIIVLLSSWMPGFRFAIPLIPFILLLLPDSLNLFYDLAKRYQDSNLLKLGRFFTISVICFSHIILILSFNSYVQIYAVGINEINITLGKWINQNTNESASLAIWDVGAIPYYSNIRTIDIYPKSLQDTHVFTFPEDADYILDQNITILILNDDYFEYIKTDSRFIANYRLIFNAQLFYVEDQLRIDYIYQVYLISTYYISNASITNLINSSPRFYI